MMGAKVVDALARGGSTYRKKPGVRGFSVYRADDSDYSAYNRLEDATYTGEGYYIVGTAGEVWRTRSFDAVRRSYVLDGLACTRYEDGCELMPSMLEGGVVLPVRYRDVPGAVVLAARAPKGCGSIDLDLGNQTVVLRYNAPLDRFGQAIEHGEGDMLVCPLFPKAVMAEEARGVHLRVFDEEHVALTENTYVVNGAVFERTYERC